LILFSCKAPQTVTSSQFSQKDSVYIIEKPVLVNVPGAVVQTQSINIDSLANLLRFGVSPQVISKTLIREDPETGLKVGILIDQLGNLTALCEQQDRMIEMMQQEINRFKEIISTKETTTTKPVSFWKRLKTAILFILIGTIIIPLTRLIIRLLAPIPPLGG
jgi:hypothetical protein